MLFRDVPWWFSRYCENILESPKGIRKKLKKILFHATHTHPNWRFFTGRIVFLCGQICTAGCRLQGHDYSTPACTQWTNNTYITHIRATCDAKLEEKFMMIKPLKCILYILYWIEFLSPPRAPPPIRGFGALQLRTISEPINALYPRTDKLIQQYGPIMKCKMISFPMNYAIRFDVAVPFGWYFIRRLIVYGQCQ